MKNKFTPKQWVLARDKNDQEWTLCQFSHYRSEKCTSPFCEEYKFATTAGLVKQCIPYEGNEHLLGTTDDFEPPYEPKDGDFVKFGSHEPSPALQIFKSFNKIGGHYAYASLCVYAESGKYVENIDTNAHENWYNEGLRPATEEEKQLLLDAMHKAGKDWDSEKKKIVEYKWKPKQGDTVLIIEYNDAHGRFIPVEQKCDWNDLKSNAFNYGMMFNVNDDFKAQEFCERLNQAIYNVK